MTISKPTTIDVCICTFRRSHLAQTLGSIADLDAQNLDIRVVVSDNDAVPSAQVLVETAARSFPFPVRYLHSPSSNISLARNACLDAASADFIAFVDDDEIVSKGWLRALVRAAFESGGDVVLGPVKALYDFSAPRWMSRGDFHSTAPVMVRGAILTGYTCNALIRLNGPARGLRFDLALGRSGGEDTEFFYRLHDLGGQIVAAESATVYEPVPPARARMSWLLQRKLRAGQTHGMRIRRSSETSPVTSIALAAAKMAYCLLMAGVTAFSPIRWRRNVLRAALHFGVVGGITGSRQAVLYGEG